MTDAKQRAAQGAPEWDAVLRPRLMPRCAYAVAAVITVVAVVAGVLLKIKSTGAYFRTADQIAVAAIGIIIAAAILLLARPRLRVGPSGLAVRNLLGDRLIPWNDVMGLSFPAGKRWARVEIPDYEYVPVLAIQSIDRELAVESMDTLRALIARYRPDKSDS